MTTSEYQELVEFLAGKFDRIDERFDRMDRRFDGLEGRMTATEVALEVLRDDLRAVAEGVAGNADRLDRVEMRLESLDERVTGLEAAVRTGFSDHERRLRALEA